jgi:hypothetical protein
MPQLTTKVLGRIPPYGLALLLPYLDQRTQTGAISGYRRIGSKSDSEQLLRAGRFSGEYATAGWDVGAAARIEYSRFAHGNTLCAAS